MGGQAHRILLRHRHRTVLQYGMGGWVGGWVDGWVGGWVGEIVIGCISTGGVRAWRGRGCTISLRNSFPEARVTREVRTCYEHSIVNPPLLLRPRSDRIRRWCGVKRGILLTSPRDASTRLSQRCDGRVRWQRCDTAARPFCHFASHTF